MRFLILVYRKYALLGHHYTTYNGNSFKALEKIIEKYGFDIIIQVIDTINTSRSIHLFIDKKGHIFKSYTYYDHQSKLREFKNVLEFLDDCVEQKDYDLLLNVCNDVCGGDIDDTAVI